MLRYYDQIGLLRPSARTPSGHRLYRLEDLARLQRVLSLRQLGFAVEEIGECLRRPEFSLERVVSLSPGPGGPADRGAAKDTKAAGADGKAPSRGQSVSVDEFIRTIEAITMSEKYLTPQQIGEIDTR